MTVPASTRWHQLRISLKGVEPKVDREFVAPSDLRLDRLHTVIQIVMGWEGGHSHEFIVGSLRDGVRYGRPAPGLQGFGAPLRAQSRYTLAQIAPAKGAKFRYGYDFGDDWHHELTVKAVLDATVVDEEAPFCIKARGACPPEDCGGPWGYRNLIESLGDPKHPDHGDAKERLGGDFDPGFVDVDAINLQLEQAARQWRESRVAGPRKRA